MSDYRECLADAHGVMALLEAEARGQREIAGLYDRGKLIDLLELQSERLRYYACIQECCGDEYKGTSPCGSCKRADYNIGVIGNRIAKAWENVA